MHPWQRGALTVVVQAVPILIWGTDRLAALALAAWVAAHLVWLERGALAMLRAAGGQSSGSTLGRVVRLVPRLGILVLGLWWIVSLRKLAALDVVLGMAPGHLLYGTWLILGLKTSESETTET